MKILIAEDVPELAKAIQALLIHSKYAVDWVDNGIDALEFGMTGSYDAIILDIMMPGKDGIEVLKELRRNNISTPIMILTAKGELTDRVSGLDCGADDYLIKPFATTELLARVRALLRRSTQYTAEVLTLGNLRLNCSTFELSCDTQSLRLGNKEFQVMEFFMHHPRQIFSTEELMQKIWGWSSHAEINVVWTNISYLRRKLDQLGADVEIRSIRGAGYCISEK